MRGLTFGLIGLVVLSLSGCGKHSGGDKKQTASATADQTSTSQVTAAQSAPVAVAASSECPSSSPDKAALARSIDASMQQIYGPDEAGAKFNVRQIATTDCRHLVVTYAGPGSSPQTAPVMYGDDSLWHLTLFNKQYPVR